MTTRVRGVAVRDYRSIASCDVDLQPLTLLVGPNGSGKSNFLDALRFLAHGMHAPLEQVVEARSGIRSVTVQALIFHWTKFVNRANLIFGAAGL